MENAKENAIEKIKVIDNRGASVPTPIQSDPAREFFAAMERMATNPDADVSKVEKFMEMRERILDRDAKREFNAAMMRAQKKIELVVAKSKNKQTQSNYADLKAVLLSAKPIYTAEGFSLMFYEGETTKENHKRVCVDIMHESGHTEHKYGDFAIQTTGIAGSAMMTQIHGEGSAYSYGRRYMTCMIFNIPTGDDDDGNGAGGMEYITDKQVSELTDMLNDIEGGTEKEYLRLMKFKSMAEIPVKDYERAKQALIVAKKKSVELKAKKEAS